jgi:hypothetical protein
MLAVYSYLAPIRLDWATVEIMEKDQFDKYLVDKAAAEKQHYVTIGADKLAIKGQEDGSVKEIPNLQKQLILDYVHQIIFDQAKSQLDAAIDSFGSDKTRTVSVANLDYDKLSLAFIASIPPARRGAVAISDEEWKEFFADYGTTMQQGAGKTKQQIENHVKILEAPRKYRAKKELLGVMLEQVNLYGTLTPNLDDFATPFQKLVDTLKRFIEEEDQIDITAL